MKQFLGFVLFVAIVGGVVYYFFPGLFAEVPTERMARSAVEDLVAGQSKDITIDLFQKIDGQERTDAAGVRRYVLEYKCAARFRRNVMWSFRGDRFETTDPLPENASRKERRNAEERLAGKSAAKAGDTVLAKGKVEFESKESGWVVTTVSLSLDR